MDSLTAGTAIIATELCMAIVMAGIYVAAPKDTCLRYWMLAELCIALGVLLIVANGGAPRYPVLIVANNSLVWGGILQWWGVQSFYGERAGKAGWMIGVAFLLLHLSLLLMEMGIATRVVLLSATLFSLLALTFRTLWKGTASERSFGARLVLVALGVLMMNNVLRSIATLLSHGEFHPMTQSSSGVTVMYMVPLMGTLAYASGVLVLYFERLVREKHFLATHDELTGLMNRRAIVAAGEREAEVARRQGQSLAVAFVDIDFFKQVNDRLGHEAGDAVLADMAQILKKSVRNIDLVGRYGGEEFCIVFPGADHAAAAALGERLVAAARAYLFQNHYPVTVSAGLASSSGGGADCQWTTLINRADAELYKAKAQGRNQFCIADEVLAFGPKLAPLSSVGA